MEIGLTKMTGKQTAQELIWDLMDRLARERSITMDQYHELEKVAYYLWKVKA